MREVEAPQESEARAKMYLDRLIAEQGVRPIANLDELAALWPADDDPDALMNFVLSERQARVQLDADEQQSK
ncbi:MAG TPA: hypothetical protein VMS31_01400 [Pyrinomonadaceae bacterium]|nr:hypothetical protein [Pyrinomonadaceae bacterium]